MSNDSIQGTDSTSIHDPKCHDQVIGCKSVMKTVRAFHLSIGAIGGMGSNAIYTLLLCF